MCNPYKAGQLFCSKVIYSKPEVSFYFYFSNLKNLKMKIKLLLLIAFFLPLLLSAQEKKQVPVTVADQYAPASFPLVHAGQAATVYVDAKDAEVVRIAAEAFRKDVESVTAQLPGMGNPQGRLTEFSVIIGTVGNSEMVDRLLEKENELSAIKGQWEAFSISVIEQPFAGVRKALLIAGSDPRGTAFGIFELSRLMGVSPWQWWADVVPDSKENLYITAGNQIFGPPAVKYRGIFLNDEDWGLQPWAAGNMDTDVKDIGPKTYSRIFELLLRLKANLIWPAMHPSTKAFFHYPGNPEVAKSYSIVIGTSHAEPMLRNNVDEWDKESMGPFDYKRNKQNVYDYWDKRAAESSENEAIYTVGMRGIHDSGMEGVKDASEAAQVLEEIIADQRKILAERVDKDVASIPQAFTAYKEVLDIYDHGLELPEDITIVWPDDNYGYIRRLSNKQEQQRPGGAGVYYHASYWGRPHDYLWLSSTHPALIWEEMWKAYQLNARDMWVLNVGDIKPLEYNISLFMDMAWNMEDFNDSQNVKDHLQNWVQGIFGNEKAEEISEVLWQYYQLSFERRPEFMGWSRTEPTTQTNLTEYNHFYYGDEAQKRIDRFSELEKKVKEIRQEIEKKDADAFYQLVYYPVVTASFMNKKFLYRDKSYHYAKQNRTGATDYARLARQYYDSIVAETDYYNNKLSDGKWKGIMSMEPRDLPVYKEPVLPDIQPDLSKGLGVIPEGFVSKDSSLYATEREGYFLPQFYPWANQKYFIDLYQQGVGTTKWLASASKKWISLSQQKGYLRDVGGQKQQRIWVSIDWAKVPPGKNVEGIITVKGAGKATKIKVKAINAVDAELQAYEGFVEENGYISIHAENYSSKRDQQPAGWKLIEGLGYTGNALMSLPLEVGVPESGETIVPKDSILRNAPLVAYDFYSLSDTTASIYLYTLPTHPISDGHGMRLGVSVDDGPIEIVDFRTHGRSEEWKENVLRNNAVSRLDDQKISKGKHSLKVYMLDPGVVLDRIIIDLGGFQKAYSSIPETKK